MSVSYLVYRTCLEMANDRGYSEALAKLEAMETVNNQDDFDTLMENVEDDGWEFSDYTSDFPSRYNKSFSLVHTTEDRRLFVIFGGNDRKAMILLSMLIQSYRRDPEGFELEVIYVHQKDFKSPAKADFTALSQRVNVQNWTDLDLMKNPGYHQQGALRYEKMSPEESDKLLGEMYLKPSQALKIYASDPPVKYLGARRGDVYRIVRSPNIEGSLCREMNAYRVVV